MDNKNKDEHNILISHLQELSIKEVVILYIEAKMGPQQKKDWLSLGVWDSIEMIGDMLNKSYGFNENESPFKKY